MREDLVDFLDDPPVEGDPQHALSLPRSGRQPTSFTAVNGDSQGNPPVRPVDAIKSASTNNESTNDTIAVATQLSLHGWRPNTDSMLDVSTNNKRKRSPSPNRNHNNHRQGETNDDGRESPKRRQTSAFVDSAVDLTSPDKESQPPTFAYV